MKVVLIRSWERSLGYDDYETIGTIIDQQEIDDKTFADLTQAVSLVNSRLINSGKEGRYEIVASVNNEIPLLIKDLETFRIEEKERLRKEEQKIAERKRNAAATREKTKITNLINNLAKTLNITKEEAERRILASTTKESLV